MDVFHRILEQAVLKANAAEHVEIVHPSQQGREVDVLLKIPPAHTMEIKAQSSVKAILRQHGCALPSSRSVKQHPMKGLPLKADDQVLSLRRP